MTTIFLKELRRTRFSLIIWAAVAGLIIFFGILEYPALQSITGGAGLGVMMQAINAIPLPGQLVFGIYNVDLSTPIGYYIVMYYWAGLVVFTHAVYTGASIVSKESRDKTAEYLLTKPYKRGTIVWAKILAALVNILVVGLAALILSIVSMLAITSDAHVYGQILLTGAGMILTQCALLVIGLLSAALFKSYRGGVFAAVAALIICYCLMFAAQVSGAYYFLSPMAYFDVSYVAGNGLNGWLALLTAVVIAAGLFVTQRVYRKKVMVG